MGAVLQDLGLDMSLTNIWNYAQRGVSRASLLVLLGQAMFGRVALAQRWQWADSTPARIMSLASREFPHVIVMDVLRQRSRAQPLEKRRELGDSVIALAIRVNGAADAAVGAIAAAGYADRTIGGIPDREALDRLIRIHREARSDETRNGALGEMPLQIDPYRAVPYLRSVVVSPTDQTTLMALRGIVRLASDTGLGSPSERADTEAVLRQLLDQHLVRSGVAVAYLCKVALDRKWPVGEECKGIID